MKAGRKRDRYHAWKGTTFGNVPSLERYHVWKGNTFGKVTTFGRVCGRNRTGGIEEGRE